jgi:pimeloyl-ACP methyl ester carboxylesterase
MGAGSRAGWYSYDLLDNRHHRSATRIVPELQHLEIGMVFPALPDKTDGFTLVAYEPDKYLILDFKAPDGTRLATWTFVLEAADDGHATRLIVRARGRADRLGKGVIPTVHFIMQRKQLLGIAERAESAKGETAMSQSSGFKTSKGEAAFRAAYDGALKLWSVPYEQLDVATRFGSTHVIVSGPKDAPPLVLLHGYMATSTMWAPNVAAFTEHHRIFAIDVMGQSSKSIPGEPIRNAADYVTWLTETLNALHLDRVSLAGTSYGGWLALTYAVAVPERVEKLVLLSAGGFMPMAKEFSLRGMLMVFFPTRFTVDSFMRWLGFKERREKPATRGIRDFLGLVYLGLKHFRMPQETMRVMPTVLTDDELRRTRVATLVLYGEHEVICDPATALERARRVLPDAEGDLIPDCSHDMCVSQSPIVNARVLEFLTTTRAEAHATHGTRSVA